MARTVFKTAAFVRSATLPVPNLPACSRDQDTRILRLTKAELRAKFVRYLIIREVSVWTANRSLGRSS